ncbi:MAG: GNAT family N-acetyltransferase [Deltaproteobacteria bacterium]|nr:GNAT family N-acetyltransferase [Deltaproteobacteria bacterium]
MVSTPPDLLATVGATMGSLAPANAFHAEVLAGVLGARLYRVVGPTWFSYTDEAGFKPAVPRDVRPLKPKDKETLLELAMACPPDEWEAAGFEVGQTGLFGGFVGSELACVGRAARFGEGIVGIGVITRPARRGQGLATALVSDLTRRTLEQGFVPQLRMDAENQAAVSMAMALGYEPYAATLVARLR